MQPAPCRCIRTRNRALELRSVILVTSPAALQQAGWEPKRIVIPGARYRKQGELQCY